MVRRRYFRGLGRDPGDVYECGNPETELGAWEGRMRNTDVAVSAPSRGKVSSAQCAFNFVRKAS